MSDIIEMIRRDVDDDGLLKVRGFTIDTVKKGFLGTHQKLAVTGTVRSNHDREKLEAIVRHHAGDTYEVDFRVDLAMPANS